MYSSLSKIRSLVSPYQDAFVIAMLPFFEDQVRKIDFEIIDDTIRWVDWYEKTFNEIPTDCGLDIFGLELMQGATFEDKIDRAHIKPEFFRALQVP